jgi:hypothetical protein
LIFATAPKANYLLVVSYGIAALLHFTLKYK